METERLRLRRLEPGDLELLVELDADPEVVRYLSGGAPTPRALIEQEILPRFRRESEAHPGFGYWAAFGKSTGDFVGWFSYRPVESTATPEAEIGYRLRRSAWGRGYATEGAGALLRQGFAELEIERVIATTYEENLASRRVLEKLGLRLVRSFRLDPTELELATFDGSAAELFTGEDVEYALTRQEWEALHSPLTDRRTA